MWPRRDGRGDQVRETLARTAERLQCGRGAMAAVTVQQPLERSGGDELQCGRGAMAAVTTNGTAKVSTAMYASMWPRRDGRGDDDRRRHPGHDRSASMWPRRDGRGD